jgi:undecaprenyl-diphosphatase
VEGVTEFLPISSTGHLVLAAGALGLGRQEEFLKTFEIAIQAGAIAAVLALYGKRLLTDKRTFLGVCAAFVPTAVIGLLLHKLVKDVLLESMGLILITLSVGGAALIVFELLHKENTGGPADSAAIPYKHAVLIGLFQSLAIMPGVSRAAATVVGGLLLGIPRKTIVEFSFLLAVPTILAASGLDLLKSGMAFTGEQWTLLGIGTLTSFIVALVVIRWFVRFIQGHSFIVFGVERIVVAVAAFLFLR